MNVYSQRNSYPEPSAWNITPTYNEIILYLDIGQMLHSPHSAPVHRTVI